MFSRFTHIVFTHILLKIELHSIFTAEKHSRPLVDHDLFGHSLVNRPLGCIPLLAVVINATMNIHIQGSVWMYVFISLSVYLGMK